VRRAEAHTYYSNVLEKAEKGGLKWEAMRELVRTDRFFLLVYVLKRKDADNDWVYARCREVEADPNGRLDLWAREHYKSTIITFSGSIQEICKNPEITIAIFSFNKSIAKAFLSMIKLELEKNTLLQWLFPDIFWEDPIRMARKHGFAWSKESGITVRRKTNPNEKTIEAHGLIDGQPTSKHFMLIIYNDVVTDTSVLTEEMIKKTTAAWELSQSLGRDGGAQWYEGTVYHHAETYSEIIKKGIIKPRLYPATDDGTITGNPVFQSREALAIRRANQGPYTFACQMLLNPSREGQQGFDKQWIKKWNATNFSNLSIMILVDPASKKRKKSDYTVMWVVGLGADRNYYVLEVVRDKLNLTERTKRLFSLHENYSKHSVAPMMVGYEEYGAQADVEHMEAEMERLNYRFHITRLGGKLAKTDRILRLVPLFESSRIYLPISCKDINWEGKYVDYIEEFVDHEFITFPFGSHDDMLDGLARVIDKDMYLPFPTGVRPINDNILDRDDAVAHDEQGWDPYAV